MAGSLTYRSYVSDNGITYSIKCDESNAKAIATSGSGTLSGELLPARSANSPLPPVGLKFRYANTYQQDNPDRKRTFKFSTAAAGVVSSDGATILAEVSPNINDTGAGATATFVVTSIRGERARKAPPFNANDTGLTDGTLAPGGGE